MNAWTVLFLVASVGIQTGFSFTAPEPDGVSAATSQLLDVSRTPRGLVRFAGRVLHDDNGPFLGLGASLFWGVWGAQHDRMRLVQHFDLLRAHGFEFVRVLGAVAGPSWEDRAADPRAPGYDTAIAGLTDLAFDHGLRIGWTIFGNTAATPAPADRRTLIDRFLAMSKGREHKIFFFEIANEGWQTGFGDKHDELRALGRYLNERTAIPVALTSLPLPLQCGPALTSIYGPGAADFVTLHFNRDLDTADGRWGPVRQPLRWPSLFGSCLDRLPAVASNGEPIGPQSSVESEQSPLHVVTGAAVTFTAGLPIHVWHTGPGVRGGGNADRQQQRVASMMELTRVDEMLRGFAALKRYLPPDLPGWSRFDVTSSEAVLQIRTGGVRKPVEIAAARRGDEFVIVPFGIGDPLVLHTSLPVHVEVRHPVTGAQIAQQTLTGGGRMPLPPEVAALAIIARAR